MATGALLQGGTQPDSYGTQSLDATRAAVDIAGDPFTAADLDAGTLTDTQPIVESPLNYTGGLQPGFVDDYYNRFHFSALSFTVGNIVGALSRTLTMWNSYFVPKTLEIVSSSGTAGVNITGTASAGQETVRPLEQVQTVFNISVDGDPLMRARFTFRIDDPE